MMSKVWRYDVLLYCLVMIYATPAWAHQLKVFATAIDQTIRGRVYFAGGAAASGAQIIIIDPAGNQLAHFKPDAMGRFHYHTPAAMDVRVIADSGDGHRAEWLITAAELTTIDASQFTAAPSSTSFSTPAAFSLPANDNVHKTIDPALVATIENAVAQRINPLRMEMRQYADRLRITDILAGIGYIIGVTGYLVWWRRQRHDKSIKTRD